MTIKNTMIHPRMTASSGQPQDHVELASHPSEPMSSLEEIRQELPRTLKMKDTAANKMARKLLHYPAAWFL